jgi:Pectate lyase superfamily protein
MSQTKPDSSQIIFKPSGIGAVASTVQNKLRESVSVKDFGAVGDGVADDTAAIQAAIAISKKISFPTGIYVIKSQISLASIDGLCVIGDGIGLSKISKQFNGDLFLINNSQNFKISEMEIIGNYGTYTGRCAVFQGTSHFPILENIVTSGFSGSHVEFNGDSGFGALVLNHTARLGSGQTSCTGISLSSSDTGYSVRKFVGLNYSGPIDLSSGCNNVFISSSQFTTVITSNLCGHLFITGCRWGNAGIPVTIHGDTHVIGCSFAQSITLDSSFDASFIGNHQDGGTFPYLTNNSPGCHVFHNTPDGVMFVNKAKFDYQKSGEIEVVNSNSIGDTNYTYVFGASPAIVFFSTNLTQNRTITLPTTGGRTGVKVRFVRNGGDSGGTWNIAIGATSKALLANTWADVLFNGSYWVVIGYGTL